MQEDSKELSSFDVASLAPSGETTEVIIINPMTNRETDMAVVVYGRDSAIYKEALRAQIDRRLRSPGRRVQLTTMTAAEIEAESIDLLVKCTVSWRNVVWKGQPIACTPENVRMVYEAVPTVREQIDEAIGDRTRFMRR